MKEDTEIKLFKIVWLVELVVKNVTMIALVILIHVLIMQDIFLTNQQITVHFYVRLM